MNKLKQIPEFLRFVMVGLFATGLHYGIYFVLQKFIQVNVAYTVGICAVVLLPNFYSYGFILRFGQPPSVERKSFWRSGGAHLTNYLIHIGLLNLFLRLGFSRPLAPIPVFLIAIPVNFY